MLITLNQYATHHILQTRTDITRNTNHTQSCPRSCAGSNVNSHQATQKANQHTDTKPEKHHGQSIQPKVYTGNKQEEAESHHIHRKDNNIPLHSASFIREIKQIVAEARQKAYSAINSAMVEAYWQMGKRIVEEEQQGKERADYEKQLLKELLAELTKEFGKGFSTGSLYYYRQFYNTFPKIFATPWRILSWSHYKRLIQVSNPEARAWYLKEAQEQMWSYRTLDRNIGSQYYERLLLSHNKGKVENEMKSLTLPYQQDKLEFIKNPTVAEFIGLSPNTDFTESKLESAIIGNLQRFLLELGKGFSYVTRQKLVRTEKKDYYIDLVFYNYLLKCFVLIDLKTNPITHQDVGQMDIYVQMYDELMRSEGDNPTIGIVLCSETDEDIARYSVLHDNNQLFASKYMLYMPTEEELRNEIERQKAFYVLQHSKKGIE